MKVIISILNICSSIKICILYKCASPFPLQVKECCHFAFAVAVFSCSLLLLYLLLNSVPGYWIFNCLFLQLDLWSFNPAALEILPTQISSDLSVHRLPKSNSWKVCILLFQSFFLCPIFTLWTIMLGFVCLFVYGKFRTSLYEINEGKGIPVNVIRLLLINTFILFLKFPLI